jgi:hypothetical protein
MVPDVNLLSPDYYVRPRYSVLTVATGGFWNLDRTFVNNPEPQKHASPYAHPLVPACSC